MLVLDLDHGEPSLDVALLGAGPHLSQEPAERAYGFGEVLSSRVPHEVVELSGGRVLRERRIEAGELALRSPVTSRRATDKAIADGDESRHLSVSASARASLFTG